MHAIRDGAWPISKPSRMCSSAAEPLQQAVFIKVVWHGLVNICGRAHDCDLKLSIGKPEQCPSSHCRQDTSSPPVQSSRPATSTQAPLLGRATIMCVSCLERAIASRVFVVEA